jgi:Signal transduction histidine kinase
MSLKNKSSTSPLNGQSTRQRQRSSLSAVVYQLRKLLKPSTLQLRLVLWYGMLIALALSIFVLLVLFLTKNALNQSVDSAIRAEARAASLEVESELYGSPPYWPTQLSLELHAYRDPGIVIEVVDVQGIQRYDSDGNPATHIPVSTAVLQTTHTGGRYEYHDYLDGEPVRIEAIPIYTPEATPTSDTTASATPIATNARSVIGTLLVAKSLQDVTATIALLQTLLLLTGSFTLLAALLGGWTIAAHVLQPVSEMAKTARTIARATAQGTRIGNLSSRVKRPHGNDEIAQVVDALNDMLANLQKATQGQRRFVADASHELRAPLTTIQGNLAFLQRHSDNLAAAERQTMLNDAYEETLRLAQLVEELLLLARADAKLDTLQTAQEQQDAREEWQLVEVDHVVLQLVRQLRGRLHIDDTTPTLAIGSIAPVRIWSDEESLRRAILILIDNALKYTPAHVADGRGHIVVSVERKEKDAVVQVSDNGIGIAADELVHIFERFYRADRARLRQGTGLGLSIAQTLIEQLSGHITAESVPGKGSTFSIWLPLA